VQFLQRLIHVYHAKEGVKVSELVLSKSQLGKIAALVGAYKASKKVLLEIGVQVNGA
jgi:hypothetical protein